jgi:ESS family glutamate:Na+ symporter
MSSVSILKLSAVQVLALACIGAALGAWLKRRISLLDRLNIPAPVVGGLVFALITLALRDRFLNLEMDLVLRDILMIAFFTSVGMSASLRLLKAGGLQVLLFYALASAGTVLQNLLGVGLAQLLGLNPLLGIICGSVTMAGGPATALAFGSTFERLGVEGAVTVGVAAATFGIVAGGLLGGWVGGSLIERFKLKPQSAVARDLRHESDALVYSGDSSNLEVTPLSSPSQSEHSPLFRTVILIAVAMGAGSVIGLGIEKLGLVLPAYIGAMLVAALLRNLDDRFHWFGVSQHLVDAVGAISLTIFIVMALLTLRLWELVHLALPMLAILMLEVVLVWVLCITVTYRTMGKDYDAAVMSGGFCGFMLGTTANALACMDVLVRKYGPAPRAYIVVPLVGAFLIDFTNALVITTFMNLFR